MKTSRMLACVATMTTLAAVGTPIRASDDARGIQPWPENPLYWQYKGEPVVLIGGSDDDNLFQWQAENLGPHLDLLRRAGGNYVRNTMSDRQDRGFELYPFARRPDGTYDLERWNDEYWQRFDQFLQWTAARDIIVQIEVWDRFDYSREHWLPHPYNPKNNVNYTYEESGFAPEYPQHPGENLQPFFFTTPAQRNNTVVLRYQQRFVDRMLSHSLKYHHVLYCMNNETKGEEEWSRYWAEYIKAKAREAGRRIYLTEMWDDWDITAERHRRTFDHPERYDFVDVSQNNHNSGEQHWRNALWVRRYLSAAPRPINTVKTYGADGNRFGHTDQDGLERFFRHLLAGFASVRFHRPDSGLGLNAKARAAIVAARRVESHVRWWDLTPSPEVLTNGAGGQVYVATAPDGGRVLYFPKGGSADLPAPAGQYEISWVGVGLGERSGVLDADQAGIALAAPGPEHWIAIVRRNERERRRSDTWRPAARPADRPASP
jgi:hypothetical protein